MFERRVTWNCKTCSHKHSVDQWEHTAEPKHCHACGSLAVVPSNDPTYDWTAAAFTAAMPEFNVAVDPPASESIANLIPESMPPEPPREPRPEPPRKRVKIPDDIQVDRHGTEVKTPPPPPPKPPPPPPPKPKAKRENPKPRKKR